MGYLESLSVDEICRLVASTQNVQIQLEALANPSDTVRGFLAKNPYLSFEVKRQLVSDTSSTVKAKLAAS